MKKGRASIIIRARNEEEKIGACLASVFNQKYKNFEVIIVDSESSDKTLEIAKEFPVKVIGIKKDDFTYGSSLNIGCRASEGEYIVFLSAHAVPVDENWLSSILSPFNNEKVAGVSGKQVPFKDCNPLDKRHTDSYFSDEKIAELDNPVFSNSNSAVLREAWEKIPFNEKLTSAEDYLWAKDARRNGLITAYQPSAAVFHSHNESSKQVYDRFYKEFYEVSIVDNKVNFNLLSTGAYCFFLDAMYILKNGYSPIWIIKSLARNCLLTIAAISSYLAFIRYKLKA